MILNLEAMLDLARRCAPAVAPETLVSVAQVESGFDTLVIAANTSPRQVSHPATPTAAVSLATALIRRGANVDLGLGQINSRNLPGLGLTLTEAFDPCRNLAASARLLQAGYLRAAPAPGQEQAGLGTALSFYNTGDANRGFQNGYVARVTAAAVRLAPVIAPTSGDRAPIATDAPPSLDIFARRTPAALAVF